MKRSLFFSMLAMAAVWAAAFASDHRRALADEGCHPVPVIEQWTGQHSAQQQPKRVVVPDAEQWKQLWRAMRGRVVPTPEPPKVDFREHMVVAAFMGTKPTGGYAVRITRVAQNGKLIVSVREQSPGPGDMVTMALTSPYHVVVVPRSEKPVEFVADREKP
jgi:hypothetical protein